jgi:hypothetical protein
MEEGQENAATKSLDHRQKLLNEGKYCRAPGLFQALTGLTVGRFEHWPNQGPLAKVTAAGYVAILSRFEDGGNPAGVRVQKAFGQILDNRTRSSIGDESFA